MLHLQLKKLTDRKWEYPSMMMSHVPPREQDSIRIGISREFRPIILVKVSHEMIRPMIALVFAMKEWVIEVLSSPILLLLVRMLLLQEPMETVDDWATATSRRRSSHRANSKAEIAFTAPNCSTVSSATTVT